MIPEKYMNAKEYNCFLDRVQKVHEFLTFLKPKARLVVIVLGDFRNPIRIDLVGNGIRFAPSL